MHELFQYMLKWSIALGVAFIFYRLVLRPLTFYQWNRRFLILYSIVAFFIPFINLYTYVPAQQLQNTQLVKYIPAITINAGSSPAIETNSFNPLLIISLLIAAGSVVLLVRLLLQWYSLKRIRSKAVPVYHPQANVYHVDEHVIPFSFGDAIYINTTLHSEEELHDIIMHEYVHVKQKHSFDIIWSEILCILNWYNPFAWCIRHAIRQNLEFIADQAVLKNGLDKKAYQYHLLKVIGSPQYSIANNFNFSSLKKRIAMMNRFKSARVHLVKFLFVLPLLAVLLVAFRENEGWYNDIKTDTIKKPDILVLRQLEPGDEKPATKRIIIMKQFYSNNPDVKEVSWSADDELIVYSRNGRREVYELDSERDMEKFKERYGQLPSVLHPSLDAPFALDILETLEPDDFELADIEPVEMADLAEEPLMLEAPDIDLMEELVELDEMAAEIDIKAMEAEERAEEMHMLFQDEELQKFYKRNPKVKAVMWRNDNIMILKKDGTLETYHLGNKRDMQGFVDKYGDPPPAPPPPPHPSAPPPPEEHRLPEGVKSAEMVKNILILKRHDGSTEAYDLTNPKEKADLERKYGEIIELIEIPKVLPPKGSAPVTPADRAVPSQQKRKDHVLRLEGNRSGVQIVDDVKQDNPILYSDNIVIEVGDNKVIDANEPHWYLKKQKNANPIYYLNGKKTNQVDPDQVADVKAISHIEVIGDRNVLNQYGIKDHNAIINIITKDHALKPSAYMARESVATIEEVKVEARMRNTLYIGIENPLNVKVEGVPDNEIVVTMGTDNGVIRERNGRYFVLVNGTGNVEIKIYRRKSNGEVQLLNKRVFRAEFLPNPNQKLNTFNSSFPLFKNDGC